MIQTEYQKNVNSQIAYWITKRDEAQRKITALIINKQEFY